MTDSMELRKVIYSELMPDCKSRYFVLLECGHFKVCDSVDGNFKRKRCHKCFDKEYSHLTIGRLLKHHKYLSTTLNQIRFASKRYLEISFDDWILQHW